MEHANQKGSCTILRTHSESHPQNVHKYSFAEDIVHGGRVGNPQAHRGNSSQQKGYEWCVTKLTSTQRAGTLAVTGGLRTTPTDVLDLHAYVMPLHLEINKICHRAASRIATLPPSHPLHKPVRLSSNPRIKHHRSPLHQLMQTYDMKPQEMETISPAPRNPALAHKRPFTISVSKRKDDSIEEDARATEAVKIYMDRSAQDRKVGAVAILTRQGEPNCVLNYHLGVTERHVNTYYTVMTNSSK